MLLRGFKRRAVDSELVRLSLSPVRLFAVALLQSVVG